jgi:hypothetical protein
VSVSFEQCYIFILTCCSYTQDKQSKPGNLLKGNDISKTGENWMEEFSYFFLHGTLSWLRRLVVRLSLPKPRFDRGPAHARFVMDKVTLGRGFLTVSRFSRQYHSTSAPYSSSSELLLSEGQTGQAWEP